jgi:hypothetical protein
MVSEIGRMQTYTRQQRWLCRKPERFMLRDLQPVPAITTLLSALLLAIHLTNQIPAAS